MRERNEPGYTPGSGDAGMGGGGTYTTPRGNGSMDPTIQDYENIFGPAARDIKMDLQRNKRHARYDEEHALVYRVSRSFSVSEAMIMRHAGGTCRTRCAGRTRTWRTASTA